MAAGAPALPPLWPGSRTTTRARAVDVVVGSAAGAGRALAEPARGAAGAVADATALGCCVPGALAGGAAEGAPHAASTSPAAIPDRRRARRSGADTRRSLPRLR